MSLPAELLLPCTELQKQAEELVRNSLLPAASFRHIAKTLALIEKHFTGVQYFQEYSELLDQVRGRLYSLLAQDSFGTRGWTILHA